MKIADLNHLETVEANVTGARGSRGFTFYENDFINLDFTTDIDLDDNSAVVTGTSVAFGNKTATKIEFSTLTTPFSSSSSVFAISATD